MARYEQMADFNAAGGADEAARELPESWAWAEARPDFVQWAEAPRLDIGLRLAVLRDRERPGNFLWAEFSQHARRVVKESGGRFYRGVHGNTDAEVVETCASYARTRRARLDKAWEEIA